MNKIDVSPNTKETRLAHNRKAYSATRVYGIKTIKIWRGGDFYNHFVH
ncbi:MAG: hypothetical protein AAB488_02720 [Patescibacteria group bacterium]